MFKSLVIAFCLLMVASMSQAGDFTNLIKKHPEINQFVVETYTDFNIDEKSIRLVLAREFYWRLHLQGKNTKQNRLDAMNLTLNWCRYWRDMTERIIVISPELLSRQREAECFFRSLERR